MDCTGRPLHTQDLVKLGDRLAIVERTHEEIETHIPFHARFNLVDIIDNGLVSAQAFRQFKKTGAPPKGFVFLHWNDVGTSELRTTCDLLLIARELIIGDIVKRNSSDAMSGVILNTSTVCSLRQTPDVIFDSGETSVGNLYPTKPPGLRINRDTSPKALHGIPTSELVSADAFATRNDVILYRNWIGRISLVEQALTLKLTNNSVVELDFKATENIEGGSENGFDVGDIVKTKKGDLRLGRWIYGAYNPNTKPIGTIVNMRVVHVHVQWLQVRPVPGGAAGPPPPVTLEADDFNSSECRVYDRNRRPATHLRYAGNTVSDAETEAVLDLKVRFRDLAAASAKYDGSTQHGKLIKREKRDHLGYDLNVFAIENFSTQVEVQWQDLSITALPSIDVEPDETGLEDEHDVWPGEIVQTRDQAPVPGQDASERRVERASRVGVVQKVKSDDRLATVRWCEGEVQWLANAEGGARTLLVNSIKHATNETEQLSLYDLDAPGALNVRRGDIALVGSRVPAAQSNESRASGDRDWIGEVVDTPLDGTLVIRLGDADEVRDEVFSRYEASIIIRSDGGDDFEADDDEEMGDADSEYDSEDLESETSAEEDEEMHVTYQDENGQLLDEDDVENGDWESDDDGDGDATMQDLDDTPEAPDTMTSNAQPSNPPPLSNDAPTPTTNSSPTPEPYMLLSTHVPSSHVFHDKPTATTSPVHLKRTTKEHRILGQRGSLPPNVFVRSYESRLDLLRVLIIGPSETPYAHAPFLIDMYLPPQFPTEPPQCHFHSLVASRNLGGNYRINPNLYVDGKICLSLLGTWDGDKGESWNAGKSTLLQIIVSILGLVLVREPYFNEAGLEHLQGLPNYERSSALYNEQALIRSQGLLLATMERFGGVGGCGKSVTGLEGVEDVLRALYVEDDGPKLLEKCIRAAEELMESSENGTGETTGGVTDGKGTARITKGACLKLRPVIARIKEVATQPAEA